MRDVTAGELGGSSKSALIIGPFGSSLKTSDFTDGGVPLIFVRDIRTGDFTNPRAFISEAKARDLRAHIALPGDLVVTKMGDPPGDVAIYDGAVPAVITADCIRLRPTSDYDARYLLHAFRTPRVRQQVLDITSGAAQKKVSLERFRHRVTVPVPPLDVQRRIASILDQADDLRAKRRRALSHLEGLTGSVFESRFGGQQWRETTMGDACLKVTDGTHHSPKITAQGIPYVTAKHLTRRGLDFHANPWFISPEDHAPIYQRCDPRPGDVLYIKDGATTGRAAVNSYDFPFSMLSSLALLRPDPEQLLPEYLETWLNLPRTKRRMTGAMSGAAITRLTLTKIKAVRIPIPPIDLQAEFREMHRALALQISRMERSLSKESELFASLQGRAFRGAP